MPSAKAGKNNSAYRFSKSQGPITCTNARYTDITCTDPFYKDFNWDLFEFRRENTIDRNSQKSVPNSMYYMQATIQRLFEIHTFPHRGRILRPNSRNAVSPLFYFWVRANSQKNIHLSALGLDLEAKFPELSLAAIARTHFIQVYYDCSKALISHHHT